MCGVFGFVGDKLNLKTLRAIARTTETRGPHAFGLAWVDGRNRIHAYKQPGAISRHLDLLAMASDAKALIGHCRWATNGSPYVNINNHPHPCDGGWLVHNGVVANCLALIEDHDLHPSSDCDSEVLAQLVERGEGDLIGRCMRAAMLARPEPLVTLGLWTRPTRLVAIRRKYPLHLARRKEGFYLGSLADDLAGATAVRNYSATEFTWRKGELCVQAVIF